MFVNVMCKVTNCVNLSAVTHLFFQRYGSEVDGLPEVLAEKVSLLPELLKVTKRKTRNSVTKGASIDGVVGGMLMGFQAGMPCLPRLFKLRYI